LAECLIECLKYWLTYTQEVEPLTLIELRSDLRGKLSTYKLPTLLRVVPQLQKTASMKVPKLLVKKELFGHMDCPEIQKWTPTRSKL
jgi:malonyl-CoA/methylmalonyl-CoA synthetase